MLALPVLVEGAAGRPPELLAAPRADRVLLRDAALVVRRQVLHRKLLLALGTLYRHLLHVILGALVLDQLPRKVGYEVALDALEAAPKVLRLFVVEQRHRAGRVLAEALVAPRALGPLPGAVLKVLLFVYAVL